MPLQHCCKTATTLLKEGNPATKPPHRCVGKTTLMDCIAGRKTVGLIKGDITVNGHEKVRMRC